MHTGSATLEEARADAAASASAATRETEWEAAETTDAWLADEEKVEARGVVQETFDDWFGTADAAYVKLVGELHAAPDRAEQVELSVRGQPLSVSLDEEGLVYYRDVFLPTLLREGRASWRGGEAPDGSVRDGVVAELSRRNHEVSVTFGLRVSENEPETGPEYAAETADETRTTGLPEKLPPDELDLDSLLEKS